MQPIVGCAAVEAVQHIPGATAGGILKQALNVTSAAVEGSPLEAVGWAAPCLDEALVARRSQCSNAPLRNVLQTTACPVLKEFAERVDHCGVPSSEVLPFRPCQAARGQ